MLWLTLFATAAAFLEPGRDLTPQERTLARVLLRVHNDAALKASYYAWLLDLYRGDEADLQATLSKDDVLLAEHLEEWMMEEASIGVDGSGRFLIDVLDPMTRTIIENDDLILYHHTNSTILPTVSELGLIVNLKRRHNPTEMNSGAGVYLTTEGSGCAPQGYMNAATRKRGGSPATLEVVTRVSDLQVDPDDTDLGVGRRQFVTPWVAPEAIVNLHEWVAPVRKAGELGPNTPLMENDGVKVKYRVRTISNAISVSVYYGRKKIGGMNAFVEMYPEQNACGSDVWNLLERYPQVEKDTGRPRWVPSDGVPRTNTRALQVFKAFITDETKHNLGIGKAMYVAMMDEWFKMVGPFLFMPMSCGGASGTSSDAQRVWASLTREFPSSGDVVAVLKRP